MRKTIFIFLASFFAIHAMAQHAGYKPIADLAKFKQEFSEASKKIQTIQSDFVQEKNLSMLSDKIVSKGKFWFKKNDLVRMEYQQPFQYLMIMNKNAVYIKDGQKENKMSTRSNKLYQQINNIVVDCIQGTALDNKDFTVSVFENAQGYIIDMKPISKALQSFFQTISIKINKKDDAVTSIDMLEPGGDNTVINFTNRQINAAIPDAMFAIK